MAARRLGRSEWLRTIKKLYDLIGQSEVTTSRSELATALDEPVRNIQVLLAVFRHLGIMEHSYVAHQGGRGRASRYRLVLPMNETEMILDKFGWENITTFKEDETPRRHRVAVASPRDGGDLRATSGPEAPSPMDTLRPLRFNESAAQVEAARQYLAKVSFVDEQIAEFKSRGIRIDRSAFKIQRDSVLDAITLVLPYVNSLEKQIETLKKNLHAAGDISVVRKQLEETQIALKRCQEARKAEVSARVLDARNHGD